MRLFQAAIAAMGLGLLAFVIVGFILSGRWETERTRSVAAGPDSVWTVVSDLARWPGWSSLGEVEGTLSEPSDAVGASLRWDDPIWGEGQLRLTGLEPGREVRYEVAVDEGDIQTRGSILLEPSEGGGTTLRWRESGDMGWNPLLAYFALGMERMQGQELQKALDRLEALLEGRPLADDAPASSSVPPASS